MLALGTLAILLGAPVVRAEPPVVPPPGSRPRPPVTLFHDWRVTCAGGCQALTRVISAAPGAPEALRLSIRPAGEGVFALRLRTPAPLYLPDAATLTPDRGDALTLPWFTCGPLGCEARASAGDDLLTALREGRSATVELTLVDGSRARLRLSLLGLTAALKAVARLGPR